MEFGFAVVALADELDEVVLVQYDLLHLDFLLALRAREADLGFDSHGLRSIIFVVVVDDARLVPLTLELGGDVPVVEASTAVDAVDLPPVVLVEVATLARYTIQFVVHIFSCGELGLINYIIF